MVLSIEQILQKYSLFNNKRYLFYKERIYDIFNGNVDKYINSGLTDGLTYNILGLYFYYEKNDHTNAILSYEKSLSLNNTYGTYNLASYYLNNITKVKSDENLYNKYIDNIKYLFNIILKDKEICGLCAYQLGIFYMTIEINKQLMIQMFEMAEINNISMASYYLGKHYLKQKNEKYYEKFELAIKLDKNNDMALFEMGNHHNRIQNYYEMYNYYEESIRLNNIDAMLELGQHYFNEKNYSQMDKYYKMAASMPYNITIRVQIITAIFKLGLTYQYISKNYENMIWAYNKILFLCNIDDDDNNILSLKKKTLFNYGRFYDQIINKNKYYIKDDDDYYDFENCVNEDFNINKKLLGEIELIAETKMIDFYEQAIELGCDRSMTNLAKHYYYNDYINKYDIVKILFLKAIHLNNVEAMVDYAIYLKLIKHDYKNMLKYLQEACLRNSIRAMIEIGNYYNINCRNYNLMKMYYIKALKLNCKSSRAIMKKLHQLEQYFLLDYFKETNKYIYDMEHEILKYDDVIIYKKKCLFATKKDYCVICMLDNVTCISLDCGHNFCVTLINGNINNIYNCYSKVLYDVSGKCPLCRAPCKTL